VTGSGLVDLTFEECVERLESRAIGRVAVVVDGYPLVLPVNYRLVALPGRRYWVAVRTRPGGIIDRAATHVAFEVDEIDRDQREGWSVLVRGTLHRVDEDSADFASRYDPHSWLLDEPTVWMVIDAFQITGRELHQPGGRWELELS